MLDALFSTSTEPLQLTIGIALLTIFISIALGMIISFTYIKTHSKGMHSQNFILTLIMMPCIIAIIILLIGSNVARAFGLTGAFSIARFRSAPGDPKDIGYVFFAMAAGLACGVGVYAYAALFTIILCLFMVILNKVNYGARNSSEKMLKIVIPEDLDYQGAFDDIFETYTYNYQLRKVKTTDMGTLYELVYIINMRQNAREKEFLDEIRCRNGNLNVILSMCADPVE